MRLVNLVELSARGVEPITDRLRLGVVHAGTNLVRLGLVLVDGSLLSGERLDRLARLLERRDLRERLLLVDELHDARLNLAFEGPASTG